MMVPEFHLIVVWAVATVAGLVLGAIFVGVLVAVML